jgi:Family of unknown function (DUF6516)
MKATLIIRYRQVYADGAIAEAVVWRVPNPVPPSEHSIKYRLFYGQAEKRLIGYDNERGKGDHRHIDGQEEPYTFVSIEQLMTDFISEITKLRGGQND